ncbi:hypothetical protein L227DRAFT_572774 [Lentinus tigrinus ALCF2SS1-6]|uniref:Uncharacterized protein n=1 Tax=Lentinus tigrinus ALCF2SS1-6 TaxID=1328759 RepID=A0A5C2SIE3_9APHY|nr:hypothetical protein L227DRAFT_572774 [Lentinus tigrinus ALCF2SS1-6]
MEARDNGAVGVRGAQSTEVILEVIEDEDDFDDDSVDDDDFVPKGPQSPAEASLDKKVSIIVKKEPSNASNTSKTQSDQDTDAKKKDDGKKDAKGH